MSRSGKREDWEDVLLDNPENDSCSSLADILLAPVVYDLCH